MLDMLDRVECPRCGVGMVLTRGYGRERNRQVFECLSCGCVIRGFKVSHKGRGLEAGADQRRLTRTAPHRP
jgi:hypothetical protein